MLTTLDAPDHVLAWQVNGTLTAQDFAGVKEEIASALARDEPVGLYLDATGLTDMTLGAVVEDLKVEWALLDRADRFHHAAVVTDRPWMRTASRLAGRMFAKPEVRVFEPEERDAAMAFASERPRDGHLRVPGVRQIIAQVPDVLAFEIGGRIEREDVRAVAEALRSAFESDRTVDLFVRMKDWRGFAPTLFADPALWSLKLNALGHVRRYAVVGAAGWMRRAVDLANPAFEMEMRYFDEDETDSAWQWLKEGRRGA